MALSLKGELKMADDSVDDLVIFDKSDDSHLSSTARAQQRVCLIDFTDHLGPAFGGGKVFFLDDRRR